jgi:UDP-glucose 4-epimerase
VRRAGPAAGGVLLRLVRDDPFEYDVQRRVPGMAGAWNVLGFEAAATLDEMLDGVIAWIGEAIKNGTI